MLAMHPEEQETLYEHIKTKSVIQDGGLLVRRLVFPLHTQS